MSTGGMQVTVSVIPSHLNIPSSREAIPSLMDIQVLAPTKRLESRVTVTPLMLPLPVYPKVGKHVPCVPFG